MYILNNKNTTDDYIGITEINIANTPSFPKYFNCSILLNKNIAWDYAIDKDTMDLLRMINNIKLILESDADETGGWSWHYTHGDAKIGMIFK